MLKHSALAALLATTAALPLWAQDAVAPEAEAETEAAPVELPPAETVIATVNGAEITLGEMIVATAQLPPQYQQLPAEILFGGVLDQLIQQQLLAETVSDVPFRVDVALANERRSLLAGEAITDLADELVTEEAIQAAYDAAFAEAEPETEFNASHILVATEEEAIAARDRIAGGEDFATVAQELSLDTGSGAAGGELGWFGLGMMVPEFEAAVVALADGEPGTLSDPVQTDFGFHIVRVNETRLTEIPPLDAVRGELEAQVRDQAIQTRLAELGAAATIVQPEPGAYDPSLIFNLDLLMD